MKGTFKITLDYLRELGACLDGQREFKRAFPDGGGYQEVLDRCAEEGRIDFASWLFSKIGPTEDVRIFENEILDENKKLFFAGNMDFKRSVFVRSIFAGYGIRAGYGIQAGYGIRAGESIRAGYGIQAGYGIRAGCGIRAGESIQAGYGIQAGCGIRAGESIQAGDDFGVFAGLNIKIPLWEKYAVVSAIEKPKNLRSGFWVPQK